jgi:hypothetical protein
MPSLRFRELQRFVVGYRSDADRNDYRSAAFPREKSEATMNWDDREKMLFSLFGAMGVAIMLVTAIYGQWGG